MKRTDYEVVAKLYDESPSRHMIEADGLLRAAVEAAEGRVVEALDLACGTGNFVGVQRAAFGDAVRFRGLDRSEGMLERARAKQPDLELVIGRAEELPYPDASFDYVSINFALHHFEDKPRALDEVRRVCRPGARLRVANIDPPRMPRWWGYQLFPEARLEDEKRFWSLELCEYELEQRGFAVGVHVDYRSGAMRLADVVAEVRRRDASQIAILSEAIYARGLAAIEARAADQPDGSMRSDLAIATLTCALSA